MRPNIELTFASLLTIVFMTIHETQDIQNGLAPRGMFNVVGVVILVVWLYGTLMLAGKRSGYIIILLANIFSCVVPVIHFKGAGVATYHDSYFVWILLALGATALFSVVLSVRGLWSIRNVKRASG